MNKLILYLDIEDTFPDNSYNLHRQNEHYGAIYSCNAWDGKSFVTSFPTVMDQYGGGLVTCNADTVENVTLTLKKACEHSGIEELELIRRT